MTGENRLVFSLIHAEHSHLSRPPSSMNPRSCLLCAVLSALVSFLNTPGQGATLLQDNFDTVTSGANINGRTLTVNTLNSNTWTAPTGNFLGDGAGGLTGNSSSTTQNTVALDLGSGFLSSNPGVYQASLTITQPNASTSSWLALGFAQANGTGSTLVANNGQPWMLFRGNNSSPNVNVYAGPGVASQQTSVLESSGTHTFMIQLDTTGANWTLDAFVDGTALDLNGATAGTSFTYPSNPTLTRYVVFGSGNNGAGTTGTVDNFQLTGPTPVPEPALPALFAGGLALWGLRRRR
jgi:hypothetical protein